MRPRLFRAALISFALSLVLVVPASAHRAAPIVTVDFSAARPAGERLAHDFFRSQNLVLSPRQCGGLFGCRDWSLAWIEGDDALAGGQWVGPIFGWFGRPVNSLSVRVAPGFQFRARFTLTAYGPHGRIVGKKSVVNSQDLGLPNPAPFEYFTISLPKLLGPACSFRLTSKLLASSYSQNVYAEFGLSSVRMSLKTPVTESSRCPAH